MTKPKRKQIPKNFFRYFVDEYILFRHDFVIEMTASVEDFIHELKRLEYTSQNWNRSHSIVVAEHRTPTLHYFEIIMYEHDDRFGHTHQSTRASGVIESKNGITLVHSNLPMSDWQSWLFITVLAIVILTKSDIGLGVRLLMVGGLLILVWLKIYIERNQLLKQIRDAVSNAEAVSKAENETISQLLDDNSEYQSHHAQK